MAHALKSPEPGRLYVVATPIGNLGDLTERARHLLETVDLIAAEDTRTTAKLLRHLGASTPLVAYHEHNEQAKALELADALRAGKSIALVSDAGTPGISDPGFRLVRECRRQGLPVEAVPGPCALTALLSVSGLPTHGFLFVGFLPPKTSARRTFFTRQADSPYTLALYESCHRILKCLDDIIDVLGDERLVCVGKELTKMHETVLTGEARTVRDTLAGLAIKGEFAVLVAPASFSL
ncbi:MAG: 16S rRNA (cytidine(1402)-2'-O)-methyltransferase [Opitutaceae bacterium]